MQAEKPLCHINLARWYGGGERQTELLVRELATRGWRQRIIVRRGHVLAERLGDVRNLEIRQCAANPAGPALAVRGALLSHAHEARAVYGAWLGSRLFGVPFLLTRRVVNPQKRRRVRDKAYRGAAAVVAISDAAAVGIRRRYSELVPDIVLDAHANLPVDEASVAAIRAPYGQKRLIGHIGVLDHSAKGQLTIIDVARRAARERPHWHFLLLGSGRDELRFRQAIRGLSNIQLIGFVENVGDYLSAFDLFIFPSLREAVGSTLLDAMHFGLPIVATRVGGIPEVVENDVNGILVEPESPAQLFAAIDALLTDEPRAAAMSRANRAKAARYGADRMADAYERIYRRILAS